MTEKFLSYLLDLLRPVLLWVSGFLYGRSTLSKKQAEDRLDAIHKAKGIRAKLNTDHEFAERVRDKYTRK